MWSFRIHPILQIVGAILFIIRGSDSVSLRLEASPDKYNELVDNQLNVTCISNGQPFWDVVTMELTRRRGKVIVVVNKSQSVVIMGPASEANMQAEGYIDSKSGKSLLTLTIQDPGPADEGMYACQLYYTDEEYQMQEEKTFINVTIHSRDVNERITKLEEAAQNQAQLLKEQEDITSRQESLLKQQDRKLKTQECSHNNAVDKLHATIADLSEKLRAHERIHTQQNDTVKMQALELKDYASKLERQATLLRHQEMTNNILNASVAQCGKEIEAQEAQLQTYIKQRKEIDSYTVAFSFSYAMKDKYHQGDNLVFSIQHLNIGGAYDQKTGIFTCPRNGIYVFNLFVMPYGNGDKIQVDFKINNGEPLTSLYAYSPVAQEQSGINTVVDLTEGDTVSLYVREKEIRDTLWGEDHYSFYSGYLLKLT